MATEQNEEKTEIVKVMSLWNGRGKVAYSTIVKEEITIPAGAKILVFKNPGATVENRRPELNVCYILEEKN